MEEVLVLVLGMVVSIKLVSASAEARARSVMLWGFATGVAVLIGYCVGGLLVGALLDTESDNLGVLMAAALAPYVLAALAAGGVGMALAKLGIKVVQRPAYDVHCRENGTGRLEIAPEAVRLSWEGRSQEVPRSQLHVVAVDGECLRLRWTDGELLLLPLGRPQTRDGRISQSQALARILSPGLPVAIRIDRNAPRSAG